MAPLELDLYVAGNGERTQAAVRNLTRLCEKQCATPYSIRIVDVLEDPDAAERQRLIATPTVLRRLPLPSRRMVGDFSDADAVVECLGLDSIPPVADSQTPRDPLGRPLHGRTNLDHA